MPENTPHFIDLNVKAPTFNLVDIFKRTIDLESYKGKKVFIGFFRHAGCPFCNLRVHQLMKLKEEKLKEHNFEMIFFFESTASVMLRSSFHQEISPIPLISDPERIWYETYGIEQSKSKSRFGHLTGFIQTAVKAKLKGLPMHLMAGKESVNTMPAEFLLDEDLIIRKLYYSQKLTDRMAMEEIIDFVTM